MANKTKYLILILFLFLCLLLPKLASAFIVEDIMTPLETALEGVEEAVNPITGFIIKLIIYYGIAFIGLIASVSFFNKAVADQTDLLTLHDNPTVHAGFNFISGIANMFLILILIAIAFAIIFKIESFQAKKTLPRLLIVALLLNFSLLFVGMMVDVVQVVYNTILAAGRGEEGQNIFAQILGPLIQGGGLNLVQMLLWLVATAMAFSVPFIAPFAQLGIALAFGAAFLPNIIIWFFQLILFFLLAGMFLIYSFVFYARVFIIQLFAILAPLAFIALILPQTKKFFSAWLKMLLEWLFVGVASLFSLVVGFRFINAMLPERATNPVITPPGFFTWFKIDEYLFYYFGVFIIMVLFLWISKKTMPGMAQGMMDFGKNIGGIILTRGLKPFGQAVGKEAGRAAAEQKGKEELAKEVAKERGIPYKPSLALRMGRVMAKPVRVGHRIAGTTPELEVAKDIERRQSAYEKRFGKDTKSAMAVFPRWKIADPHSKIAQALYLAKMEGSEGINRLSKEQQYEVLERMKTSVPHKLVDIIKHKPELITEKEARITDYGEAQKRKDEVMLMAMREYDRAMKEYDRAEKEGNKEAMKDLKAVMKDLEEKAVGKRERSVPTIRRTMVPKGMEDKDVQRLVEAKIDYNEEIEKVMKETGLGKEAARQAVLITKAAFKKAADALKDADIENLAAASFENPEFQEAIVRFKPTHFIQKVGEEKGQEYIDLIHNKFEEMAAKEEGIEEIVKTNKILLQQSITNPAFRSVFPAPRGIRELKTMDEKLGRIEKTATKVAEKEKPKSTIVTLPPEGPRVSEERLKTAKEEREKLEELRRKKKEGEKTEE